MSHGKLAEQIAVFQLLESNGFQVNVVNARYTKTLPGRKTDVLECQWLAKTAHLLTVEQLVSSGGGNPGDAKSDLRQRENLVAASNTCIQHMQITLMRMSVQLANVISDISGATGMAILRAIVAGECDAEKLSALKHALMRAGREEIARSLRGIGARSCYSCSNRVGSSTTGYVRKTAACAFNRRVHGFRVGQQFQTVNRPNASEYGARCGLTI